MKIVFFGVGAVCSVMATLLDELSNKSKQKDIKGTSNNQLSRTLF